MEVESLGHIVTLTWETAKLFSKVIAPFYISTNNVWSFQIIAILVGVKWYLIMIFDLFVPNV